MTLKTTTKTIQTTPTSKPTTVHLALLMHNGEQVYSIGNTNIEAIERALSIFKPL
jgi:hypothetical protein